MRDAKLPDLNKPDAKITDTKTTDTKKSIFKLKSNRVWRTYFGGKMLEIWQGKKNPSDGSFPEEWLASTVKAFNPGRIPIENEGLSEVWLPDGNSCLLSELIEMDPVGYLGEKHVKKYGHQMGVLAKIIDSQNRLTIQVHPDKLSAKNLFQSDYGKTEAWYILGGRSIDEEEPYILLGFKPGVSKQLWESYFAKQKSNQMLDALHKIYVKPGEVYFIDGGIPHAIGSGCFLIEIQEPTDYTIRVERFTPEGTPIDDRLIHQGIGFEKMFECFHYNGITLEETLANHKISPLVVMDNKNYKETILVGPQQTELFGMKSHIVRDTYEFIFEKSFRICVIVSGSGKMSTDQGRIMDINQGEVFFMPSSLGKVQCTCNSVDLLEIVVFSPPSS